jgi:AcrR family transcriptional regulator
MTIDRLTPTRRRELTRRSLLEAAAAVFAREGFHAASLDEVAAAAGFTKGAVYSNFKSKEDLFLALLDDRLEENVAAVQAARDADSPGEGDGFANIRDVLSYPRMRDPAWTRLYLEFVLYAARNPAAQARLVENIRRSHDIALRMIRAEHERLGITSPLPIEELATISLAVFEGLATTHAIDPSLVSRETIDATLTLLAVAMGEPVSPPPGR